MLTIIGGIAILGVLVFVHELGHFAVAKYCGVKVLKFSLGFGPRLVSRRMGETEYLICAVPLGGYVQMVGEGSGENGEEAELSAEDQARSFANKPVGVRTAIIAAGPLMNLILPFIVLPCAYMLGVQAPDYLYRKACAGSVVEGSIAARGGLLAGDCIVSLNGDPVADWEEANRTLVRHAGGELKVVVLRGGVETVLSLSDGGVDGLIPLGLLPELQAVVGDLAPGMPAAVAGMKVGDRIRTIDGEEIDSWYDLKRHVHASDGKALRFGVERPGGEATTEIVIAPKREGEAFLVGIAPLQETVERRYPFGEAVRAGWGRAVDLIKLTYVFIVKMFSGSVSASSIGGPISVVQVAGQAAQTDVASVFLVLAFLSIQLGVLNLLPIPILDGGHLFFNLMELTMRRPLSLRAREIAQQVGLALLLLLMLLAFYNDITRLVMGWGG